MLFFPFETHLKNPFKILQMSRLEKVSTLVSYLKPGASVQCRKKETKNKLFSL